MALASTRPIEFHPSRGGYCWRCRQPLEMEPDMNGVVREWCAKCTAEIRALRDSLRRALEAVETLKRQAGTPYQRRVGRRCTCGREVRGRAGQPPATQCYACRSGRGRGVPSAANPGRHAGPVQCRVRHDGCQGTVYWVGTGRRPTACPPCFRWRKREQMRERVRSAVPPVSPAQPVAPGRATSADARP